MLWVTWLNDQLESSPVSRVSSSCLLTFYLLRVNGVQWSFMRAKPVPERSARAPGDAPGTVGTPTPSTCTHLLGLLAALAPGEGQAPASRASSSPSLCLRLDHSGFRSPPDLCPHLLCPHHALHLPSRLSQMVLQAWPYFLREAFRCLLDAPRAPTLNVPWKRRADL